MFFAAGFQISDNLYLSAQPLRPRSFPGHSHYKTCGDYMSINCRWPKIFLLALASSFTLPSGDSRSRSSISNGRRSFLPKQTLFVCWLSAIWLFVSALQMNCINIPNFLSAFATITIRLSPCIVVVWALRFFLGLTFVMIRTTHAVRRAFWLSMHVNQHVFTPFEFSLSTKIIPARESTCDIPSTSLFWRNSCRALISGLNWLVKFGFNKLNCTTSYCRFDNE